MVLDGDETGCPTAPEEVWADLIKKNKSVAMFKNEPLLNYNKLHKFFDSCSATGQYAVSSASSASSWPIDIVVTQDVDSISNPDSNNALFEIGPTDNIEKAN